MEITVNNKDGQFLGWLHFDISKLDSMGLLSDTSRPGNKPKPKWYELQPASSTDIIRGDIKIILQKLGSESIPSVCAFRF